MFYNLAEVDEEANDHGRNQKDEKSLELSHAEVVDDQEREGIHAGDQATAPKWTTPNKIFQCLK